MEIEGDFMADGMENKNKTIAIRVDANDVIATGHVMRCLAIARQIRELGGKCIFFTADSFPVELIKTQGFEVRVLDTLWDDLETEVDEFVELLEALSVERVLVDTYQVTRKYLARLRQKAKITYIDDLYLFDYPVDTVINYATYCDRFSYTKAEKTLLGGAYAPLREEFRDKKRVLNRRVSDIMITTGGMDTYNISALLIKAIRKDKFFDSMRLNVIKGRYNYNVLDDMADNVVIYKNVNNMAEIMLQNDICVCAGGTTLLEVCACKLPAITFAIADNQLMAIEDFSQKGMMDTVGDIRENPEETVDNIVRKLRVLCEDYNKRREMAELMEEVTDGNGAVRIARSLLE